VFRHIFGPVPSRRLGLSLGVDLVPAKTCTYDCVFCEVGMTSELTLDRKEYVPVESVVRELEQWALAGGKADHITIAGSGEPTLHSGFGSVIRAARALDCAPVALFSNGSLFFLPEVREDAAEADLVKVSLSAWDEESFARVNLAHSKLTLSEIIDGLIAFRARYKGRLWLEVFVIDGINSSPDSLRKIAGLAADIRPDTIHLNTVERPPANPKFKGVSEDRMRELAKLFYPVAEVIGKGGGVDGSTLVVDDARIVAMVSRRACTVDEVAEICELTVPAAAARMDALATAGLIIRGRQGGQVCYRAALHTSGG
jgi:wyosine [tRNA(Phe)-imidazoG37] synthetase (radical SAM superfamily)